MAELEDVKASFLRHQVSTFTVVVNPISSLWITIHYDKLSRQVPSNSTTFSLEFKFVCSLTCSKLIYLCYLGIFGKPHASLLQATIWCKRRMFVRKLGLQFLMAKKNCEIYSPWVFLSKCVLRRPCYHLFWRLYSETCYGKLSSFTHKSSSDNKQVLQHCYTNIFWIRTQLSWENLCPSTLMLAVVVNAWVLFLKISLVFKYLPNSGNPESVCTETLHKFLSYFVKKTIKG